MSKHIDERVVSMTFDNKHFERNVQTTMSTLDKLKAKLNFTGSAKGLEDVGRAADKVDMSGLSKGVEAVQAKFSSLQVIATTCLVNITNQAYQAGERLIKSLSVDQITAGWTKYEQKTASVQTIMNATGKSIDEVNQYLDKLMWFSDETSYGFTDMTSALGQLTSAGGDIDKLIPLITGVANATAYAGKGATEFSRAMYNLNQSYSAGYLQYMDWRSLELAGIASQQLKQTFIDIAEAQGKIKKGDVTVANFAQTLKDKWADTEVMEEAFGYFGSMTEKAYELIQAGEFDTASDAYAALADQFDEVASKAARSAQEAKTFTEAIDATKDAVSSGWMRTFEIIFGNYEEAKVMWTDLANTLWDVFASGADRRNEILSGAFTNNSKWDEFTEQINEAGVATEDFFKVLEDISRSKGIDVDGLISEYGSFEKAVKKGKISTDIFAAALDKLGDGTATVTGEMKDLKSIVSEVRNGVWGDGARRIKELTDAGYDYAVVQDLVNRQMAGEAINWDELSEAQLENLGYTKEQIKTIRQLADDAKRAKTPLNELIDSLSRPTGRELLIQSVSNVFQAFSKILDTVKSAWLEVFPPDEDPSGTLYNVIAAIEEFTSKLILGEEALENIHTIIKGFFKTLAFSKTVTLGLIDIIIDTIAKLWSLSGKTLLETAANISEVIIATVDWILRNEKLLNIFTEVRNVISSVISTVIDLVKAMLSSEEATNVVTSLKDSVVSMATNLITHFGKAAKIFSDFFTSLKESDGITLDNLQEVFEKLVESIKEFFNFKKILKIVGDAFTSFMETVAPALDIVEAKFAWVGEKFKNLMELIIDAIPTVFAILSTLTIVKSLNNIAKALEIVAAPVKAISGAFDGAKNAFNALADAIKGNTWRQKSKIFLNFSLAILVLVGSLWLLTKVMEAENIIPAIITLTVMMAALGGLAFAISKIPDLDKVNNLSLLLLSLAASLVVLVYALKAMDEMNFVKMLGNVAILAAITAGLVLVTKELGKRGRTITKGALSLVGIALALRMMVGALVALDEAQLKDPLGTIISLGVLVVALKALTASCKGLGFGSAFSIMAAVTALRMMIGLIDNIAKIDTDKVVDNFANFILVFGMFALLMKASQNVGANATKGGMAILMMSAALLVMVKAMKAISKLGDGEIDKAMWTIFRIFAMFAGLTRVSQFAGPNAAKAGAMIIGMSASILILCAAINMLKRIDEEDLWKAMNAITGISAIFGALVGITKFAQVGKGINGTLITLGIVAAALSGAIALLTFTDTDKLQKASLALSMVIGVFGALIYATSYIQTAKGTFLKSAGTLIILTGVVVALGFVIKMIADLEPGKAIQSAGAISILLISMAASCAILGAMKTVAHNAGIALASVTVIVAGLAAILKWLSHENPEQAIATAKAIANLLLVMSGVVAILSVLSLTAPAALIGVGALAGIAAVIGAFLWAMAELTVHMSKDLPELGENLSKFMSNIQGFIDGVNKLDEGFLSKVDILGRAISALIDAKFNDSFTTAITGQSTFDKLGDSLESLGENLGRFTESISDLTEDDITKIGLAADAGAKLAEFIKAIPNGNYASTISNFGISAKTFGESMIGYRDAISGLTTDDIDKIDLSAKAGLSLAELANTMPKEGGIWQEIVGESDMLKFGLKVKAFGLCLVDFSKTVSNIDKDAQKKVDSAIKTGQAMVEMAGSMPKEGGVWQEIAGEQDLADFGSKIITFGHSLFLFGNTISAMPEGIDAKIKTMVGISEKLVGLTETMPKDGGIWQEIAGTEDLQLFGQKLASYGSFLLMFANSSMGLTDEHIVAIDRSIETTKKLLEMIQLIAEGQNGGLWDAVKNIVNVDDMSTFGDSLKTIGKALSSYYQSISEVKYAQVYASTVALRDLLTEFGRMANMDFSNAGSLASSLNNLGNVSIAGFVSAFEGAGEKVTIAVNTLIQTAANAVNSQAITFTDVFDALIGSALEFISGKESSFYQASEALMVQIHDGLEFNRPTAEGVLEALVDNTLIYISNKYASFYTCGSNLVQGFADGITANTFKAEAAAAAMAEAAYQAAKNALDINSPSRVFKRLASSVPEGFAGGINKFGWMVEDSSISMAQMAVDSTKDAMSRMSNIFNSDMDAKPTISPVVDMSNVDTVASDIQLDADANISALLSKPVDSLSQVISDAQAKINASNHEVIEAINGLRDDLNAYYSSDEQEIALYVDSKKLATSLAKPMNRQLNILSQRGAN